MFTFGKKSEKELIGVHPDLVRVVRRALELSPVDFSVHDGVRTLAEQQAYVDAGVSWTLKGRHLTGHAVDLVPYINGKLRWEWPPIYKIAAVVKQAAIEFEIPIRWGGCWCRLNGLGDLESAVESYVAVRKAAGKRASLDGPHMELPANIYP